jgi:hypothetical protein
MTSSKFNLFILAASAWSASAYAGTVTLSADGSDTYRLFQNTFGAKPEAPDCLHPDFGPHIKQEMDPDLNKLVFVFYMHSQIDGDVCDRKRNEQRNLLLTWPTKNAYLGGEDGATSTYRWKFRLDPGFKAQHTFTRLHFIQPNFEDHAPQPSWGLDIAIVKGVEMLVINYRTPDARQVVAMAPLADYTGKWIDAYERISYGHHGSYSITLTPMDGSKPFAFARNDLDLWHDGKGYYRPNWGLYRAISDTWTDAAAPIASRDEAVRYADFCISKGSDDCMSQTSR